MVYGNVVQLLNLGLPAPRYLQHIISRMGPLPRLTSVSRRTDCIRMPRRLESTPGPHNGNIGLDPNRDLGLARVRYVMGLFPSRFSRSFRAMFKHSSFFFFFNVGPSVC